MINNYPVYFHNKITKLCFGDPQSEWMDIIVVLCSTYSFAPCVQPIFYHAFEVSFVLHTKFITIFREFCGTELHWAVTKRDRKNRTACALCSRFAATVSLQVATWLDIIICIQHTHNSVEQILTNSNKSEETE